MFLLKRKRGRADSENSKKDAYVYVAGPRGQSKTEYVRLLKEAGLPYEDLDVPVERWSDMNGCVFPPTSLLKNHAVCILHVLESEQGISEAIVDLKSHECVMIVEDAMVPEVHDAFRSSRCSKSRIVRGIPADIVMTMVASYFSNPM